MKEIDGWDDPDGTVCRFFSNISSKCAKDKYGMAEIIMPTHEYIRAYTFSSQIQSLTAGPQLTLSNGTLWTGSKWIRDFVANHPDYQHDSRVPEGITYDLIKAVQAMEEQEGKAGSIGWQMLTGEK